MGGWSGYSGWLISLFSLDGRKEPMIYATRLIPKRWKREERKEKEEKKSLIATSENGENSNFIDLKLVNKLPSGVSKCLVMITNINEVKSFQQNFMKFSDFGTEMESTFTFSGNIPRKLFDGNRLEIRCQLVYEEERINLLSFYYPINVHTSDCFCPNPRPQPTPVCFWYFNFIGNIISTTLKLSIG